MLVTEFKEKQGYRFPDGFLSSLPETCFDYRCKSPMEMTETLTSLKCSNPRCPTKIANRIVAIMSSLGVKDLGIARANSFVSKYGINNPLLIFAYETSDGTLGDDISMDVSQRIVDQLSTRKNFTLWEYVRVANLPFIQTSALQIFGDYDDLGQAYQAIEQGGVAYIRDRLDIKKGATPATASGATEGIDLESSIQDVSIRAAKVFATLMTFKGDLFQALPFVTIIKTHSAGMKTLKVVCSEEVGAGFRTKADFYSTVNGMYPNLHVDFLSSVTKSIDYLVWAGADGSDVRVTNKVQKVRKYNETYKQHKENGTLKDGEHFIPIMTAVDFLNEIGKIMKI